MKQIEFTNKEVYILYYWFEKLREENPLYYGDHSKSLFDKINTAFQEVHNAEMRKIRDFKQEYICEWVGDE
jgi:hypothetical protein